MNRPSQKNAPTLGLDPDANLLDFADDVEGVFGIRFGRDPSITYNSVGDVYQAIVALRGTPDAEQGACGSLMVFNRLRSALQAPSPKDVTPSTPLATLATRGPTRLVRNLRRRTGLRLPATEVAVAGKVGLVALLPAIVLLSAGLFGGAGLETAAIGLLAGLAGAALLWVDSGRFPRHLKTVGDLVKHTAPLNRGLPVLSGARVAPTDPWETLIAIAADHAAIPMSSIGHDTTLVRHN